MTERKPESRLEPDVQDHIGRQLRAGYTDILNQPVPSRFMELLAELDKKEADFEAGDKDFRQNGAR
ncbi:MAG: NepR family anti-sigma factor [Hansschlegelia sp.]